MSCRATFIACAYHSDRPRPNPRRARQAMAGNPPRRARPNASGRIGDAVMANVVDQQRIVERGSAWPLGATPTATGVNFALYSQHATEVSLLLFDTADGPPTDTIQLDQRTKFVWHAHVPGVRAGQLYGYRVGGEHRPTDGLRFNEHKLLLDPYAKALTGPVRNTSNLLLAYDPAAGEGRDLSLDTRDSAPVMPRCIVIDDAFDWQGDASPDAPLESLVIYEVHAKGFTAHPSSHVDHPGTYLGFAEKISHLVSLGVNAVELLPVHEFYVDDFLVAWAHQLLGLQLDRLLRAHGIL